MNISCKDLFYLLLCVFRYFFLLSLSTSLAFSPGATLRHICAISLSSFSFPLCASYDLNIFLWGSIKTSRTRVLDRVLVSSLLPNSRSSNLCSLFYFVNILFWSLSLSPSLPPSLENKVPVFNLLSLNVSRPFNLRLLMSVSLFKLLHITSIPCFN